MAAEAEWSCQHTLLLFDSCFFFSLSLSFSIVCRATVVEWAAPWQHWQLKTCVCLSCTLCVCFFLWFCYSRWMPCRQGCQGSRWPQDRERKQKCRRKKNKLEEGLWQILSTTRNGATSPHTLTIKISTDEHSKTDWYEYSLAFCCRYGLSPVKFILQTIFIYSI